MLAQGIRNQNPVEFAQYDLEQQINELKAALPNNPVLQQQYSTMLANMLQAQFNQQNYAAVSAASQPSMQAQPTLSLNQSVQCAQNNLLNVANGMNQTSRIIDYSLYGSDNAFFQLFILLNIIFWINI